jgi:hypothetical protein
MLQTTGSVLDRKEKQMIPTTTWVGGDVIHTRHQTTRKVLVLLAKKKKKIGASASLTL